MINKKTILVFAFNLIVSLVLASCGTQATPEATATQAPATQSALVAASTETVESTPTDVPTEVPTEAPTEAPAATVSFANDVTPIIQSRCVNCHGGQRTEEGLLMRSYDEIMAGSDNGPVVVPGDVANSLLVELVTTQKMPKKGPKLTPPQIQTITDWVAAGALNN